LVETFKPFTAEGTERAEVFIVKPPAPLMISTAVVTTGTLRQLNKKTTHWVFH